MNHGFCEYIHAVLEKRLAFLTKTLLVMRKRNSTLILKKKPITLTPAGLAVSYVHTQ
jgi:hypothetical protein